MDPQALVAAVHAFGANGDVRRVRAMRLGRDLPVTVTGESRSFTVPTLEAYEVLTID